MAAFEVIGSISKVETIALRRGIRELKNLNRLFGNANWRKKKGVATVKFSNGIIAEAELHWYEAHGIGKRKMKVKKFWNPR